MNRGLSPRDTSDVGLQSNYRILITFGEVKGF